jgi:hypothetical protein
VGSGIPGTITVSVINNYVSKCVTSYATTIDVYDAPQNAGSGPRLVSKPITLALTCT